ncbi:coiled-coil domain-containing protein 22 homolog isoform X2 [Orussus abietinus]|uniref:coiled-coil domain-containing protein 22 homolog isoform X2 n=1 Tax=Orussus abietinus TaxID=222816 RepID=UPI0006263914|nr:coiled-coil domain-containing protein 22 homolog isoform X2 [Orussus abietinus]
MEEVDSIIIHSLRQIGCDLDSGITNLSGFTTELVIEATAKCLNVIRPGLGLPIMLPTNMAARFRLGATLAQACSDLGYRGDIGYQTFLYSSEVDLRRVFMFLIDKLPKEDNKTLSEPTSKPALLDKSIALAVSDSLSVPWLPHYCHNKGSRCRGKTNVSYKTVHLQVPLVERSEEQQTYYAHYQRPVPDQIQDQYCLLPSILSHNLRSIYSTPTNIIERLDWLSNQQHELHVPESILGNDRNLSRLLSNDRLQHDKDTTLEQEESVLSSTPSEKVTSISREEKEELEIEKAKTESEDIRKNVESLQDEIKKLTAKLSQLTVTLQNEDKEFEVKEERRKIKARTYDLLPNDTENIKKLHALIEAHVNKLVDLSNQWERHRDPLIKKYREEREKYSTKTSASLKKTDKLRAFREKEKELLEECRTKDQQYSQLVTEVQKLPKEINRSAYTQRILEIINNEGWKDHSLWWTN